MEERPHVSLRITNNVAAFGAHRRLTDASARMSESMERLSSGYRINGGKDDAAGLAISERMRGQVRGLSQSERNVSDGISLVQTAEGHLNEVHAMLQRVRELAVQYKNGVVGTADRQSIQSEVNQLKLEVDRVAAQAAFNGVALFVSTGTVSIQVGANDIDQLTVDTINLASTLNTGYDVLSSGVNTDLTQIDQAIDIVSRHRSSLGATQNRLLHAQAAAGVYRENLVAAESRIRDVDMAKEMVEYTKFSILAQAGQSMLSQANQQPQAVLQLLR